MEKLSSFLPKDYEVPVSPSNYMKFSEGDNRFRILGSAIVGWEYFTKDNKPVRSREPFEDTLSDIKKEGKVKAFWAFPVWNYQAESIQILELTQKGIMNAIKGYVDNEKWGNPFMYDFNVKRTGEGLDTEYQTQAEPPVKAISKEIKSAYMEKPVNLDTLFDGEDPFNSRRRKIRGIAQFLRRKPTKTKKS